MNLQGKSSASSVPPSTLLFPSGPPPPFEDTKSEPLQAGKQMKADYAQRLAEYHHEKREVLTLG